MKLQTRSLVYTVLYAAFFVATLNSVLAAAPTARILLDGGQAVGTQSAGLACLPSGKLHARDFGEDDTELARWVEAAFANRAASVGPDQLPPISLQDVRITLKTIKAKLCAKNYGIFGLGNKKSLSGTAEFGFDWSRIAKSGNLVTGSAIIFIKRDKNNSAIAPIFLRDAVNQLVERNLIFDPFTPPRTDPPVVR